MSTDESPHDFETEARQDERVETPCAVCGLPRSAWAHRPPALVAKSLGEQAAQTLARYGATPRPRRLTPPIQRAADALQKGSGVTHPWALSITPQMLNAALSDPNDPDWLARQLYMLSDTVTEPMRGPAAALKVWNAVSDDAPLKLHYRMMTDGLRILITGEPL